MRRWLTVSLFTFLSCVRGSFAWTKQWTARTSILFTTTTNATCPTSGMCRASNRRSGSSMPSLTPRDTSTKTPALPLASKAVGASWWGRKTSCDKRVGPETHAEPNFCRATRRRFGCWSSGSSTATRATRPSLRSTGLRYARISVPVVTASVISNLLRPLSIGSMVGCHCDKVADPGLCRNRVALEARLHVRHPADGAVQHYDIQRRSPPREISSLASLCWLVNSTSVYTPLSPWQAAMRAVEELSKVVNDTATGAAASAALAYGQASMQTLLWNSTYGYYRAYTGGDAIMVCCLGAHV